MIANLQTHYEPFIKQKNNQMNRKINLLGILLFSVITVYAQKIDTLDSIMLNGVNQKILLQGSVEKPIVLYLHGGPGYSSILESQGYTNLLKQNCLFVQWDQRGTGYSFNENIDTLTMSMSQFIDDTKQLTDYLLKRFKKKKLYLVGHSWGSALGLYTITKYPEKYYAFIGAGQVIARKEHIKSRIDWVCQKMIEAKDSLGLKVLKSDSSKNPRYIWKYGGIMHNQVDIDSIEKTSPYYSANYVSLKRKGVDFTEKNIPQAEQNEINLKSITSSSIPIYFFLGRYDWLTPTSYPVNYLKSLNAPKKEMAKTMKMMS